MSEIDIDALRKLAEAAEENGAPGPWYIASEDDQSEPNCRSLSCPAWGHFVNVPSYWADGDGAIDGATEVVEYLQAVEPNTILALLDRLQKAEVGHANLLAALKDARELMGENGLDECETYETVSAAIDAAMKGEGK